MVVSSVGRGVVGDQRSGRPDGLYRIGRRSAAPSALGRTERARPRPRSGLRGYGKRSGPLLGPFRGAEHHERTRLPGGGWGLCERLGIKEIKVDEIDRFEGLEDAQVARGGGWGNYRSRAAGRRRRSSDDVMRRGGGGQWDRERDWCSDGAAFAAQDEGPDALLRSAARQRFEQWTGRPFFPVGAVEAIATVGAVFPAHAVFPGRASAVP